MEQRLQRAHRQAVGFFEERRGSVDVNRPALWKIRKRRVRQPHGAEQELVVEQPLLADAFEHGFARAMQRQSGEFRVQVRRRVAEIVVDPGWIEVRLQLEEVDVDLRRAGLDLDPGWLPWLGAVVRFVYG